MDDKPQVPKQPKPNTTPIYDGGGANIAMALAYLFMALCALSYLVKIGLS